MSYHVFIDDSGQKEYFFPYSRDFVDAPPSFKDYPDLWRKNYFVLCGVRIKDDALGLINDKINALKKKYFNTSKVEIKSVWLRHPRQREMRYIKRFGISAERLNEFGKAFVALISENANDMKLFAVVFDKRYYGEQKRMTAEGTPLLKSAQVLFEKLEYSIGDNIVVFDQMEDHLRIDKGAHERILGVLGKNHGLEDIYVSHYSKIIDIKFKKSSGENFLQVADVCAYSIYRQFVEYGREWCGDRVDGQGTPVMAMYDYFEKIRHNFAHNLANQQVRGIGMTCIPDVAKKNWDLLKRDPNMK